MYPKNSKIHFLFRIPSLVILSVSAILLIISHISGFINPAGFWMAALPGLAFLPLLILNLFFFIICAFRRRKSALIPFAALIPSIFIIGKYYRIDGDNTNEGTIKIISYNVGRFSLGKDVKNPSSCMDSIFNYIREENPDIVCLQEFKIDKSTEIKDLLEKKFKEYNHSYLIYSSPDDFYGNVTLSKFPITKKGSFHFEKSANLAIYCDCKIGNKTVRIYNCHFQSYSIPLQRLAQLIKSDYKEAIESTENKLRAAILKRPEQVDMVMKDIDSCPHYSIVAGDFNDNPTSYTYNRIKSKLRDSFMDAGSGFGATYSAFWPLIRIDYILYPDIFIAKTFKTGKIRFSDHYPIETTLDIR